jgi:glycosyltransferase involved in cell wall biosynthesis
MKVIIQIPCFNEAETLPATLSDLPRKIDGVDELEILIVDDGSTDDTAEVARRLGADYVVRHLSNRGLAPAFVTGLNACLEHGADIIVNTDADNQYCAEDIPKLIEPLMDGRADLSIGARPIDTITEFSLMKKWLQRLGSYMVRQVSGLDVADAPSGFRALSRSAASQINVFSSYTYTLETIIQAGILGLEVVSVPIRVNPKTRESRLVKTIPSYVWKSLLTVGRIYLVYRPMRILGSMGALATVIGIAIGLRFVYFYLAGDGDGHIQSLILGATTVLLGVQLAVLGVVADLISVNRRLLEGLRAQARSRSKLEPPSSDKE